jgi:hypothetical protein
MTRRKLRHDAVPLEELENDPEEQEAPSDSAGQSGDDQGLSQTADVNDESVGELVETDQAYEADILEGVEDAGDHPEMPVRTREDKAR